MQILKNSLLAPLMSLLLLVLVSFQLQAQEPDAAIAADKPLMKVIIVQGRLRSRAEALADDGFDKAPAYSKAPNAEKVEAVAENRRRHGDIIALGQIFAGAS